MTISTTVEATIEVQRKPAPELSDTEKKCLARDLMDIETLLPFTDDAVGTRIPGQRATTRQVPGPKPPVSLESITLADPTIDPVKPQDTALIEPDNDTPARILNTWWTHVVDLIDPVYPVDLEDGSDRRLAHPSVVVRLLTANLGAYLATADPETRRMAFAMRRLAARLRLALGEHLPHAECPTCGGHTLHADSETGRVLTCGECGWQRTAPVLLTLDQVADVYESIDGDHWRPTLRTLRAWQKRKIIEPHTGLISDDGHDLYRLEQINDIVQKKALNGWKKRGREEAS